MRLYEAHKAAAEFLYQAPLTVKKFNGPSEHDLYRHPTSTIKTRDANRKSYPMRLTSKEEYDTWKALNGWSDDRVRDKWRLVPYPHPTNIRVVRDSWDLLRIAADMRQEAHQKHVINVRYSKCIHESFCEFSLSFESARALPYAIVGQVIGFF